MSSERLHFHKVENELHRVIAARFFSSLRTRQDHSYANITLYLKAAFWILSAAIFYFLMMGPWGTGFFRALAGMLSAASIFFAVLNLGHDAVHGCFFRSRLANQISFSLLFAILGVNGELWAKRHRFAHHPFPNVPNCDSDIDESWFLRFSPHHQCRWFHRFQHWYAPLLYCLAAINAIYIQDIQYVFKKEMANLRNQSLSRTQILFFALGKVLHVSVWMLIPTLVLPFSFWQVLGSYLLVTMPLSFLFLPIALTHLNDICLPNVPGPEQRNLGSFGDYQMLASLDWSPRSPIATFFYGGLNSHAAHHLFPNVSHRHYHTITQMIESEVLQRNLPYHRESFFGAIRSHFRFLKTLGVA